MPGIPLHALTFKVGAICLLMRNLDSLTGYYKCNHDYEGTRATYAVTQFEPTAARKAFPCWDQPAFKARFDITMISRSGTVSLSNMDVAATRKVTDSTLSSVVFPSIQLGSKSGEWTATTFSTTPNMSTYLVAFANGPFEFLERIHTSAITGKDTIMRVYTTKQHISQARLALDVTARVLPMYEEIFDIPYPLPKLDTLAVDDFDFGAMENWGLMIGRTDAYLYDEEKDGLRTKPIVTRVIAHEVAHQWFGNIVTRKWWDNLWLNEAFATLMGDLIILRRLHPEWHADRGFIHSHISAALSLNALRSSHPIEVPCPEEKAINQIFDNVSYSKGASVLRMLYSMIGEDMFFKGVSAYLKAHLYGNTLTADLWQGITTASGVDVEGLMSNWVLKVGFPLITVEETRTGIHVKQNRFLATNDVKPEEDTTIWHVPLNIRTVRNAREMTFDIPNVAGSLYKLNSGTIGPYHVLYSEEHLARLGDEAARKRTSLSPTDRLGLVTDAFVLGRAGYSSMTAALDLINKLRDDDDYFVWAQIASALITVQESWWDEPKSVRDNLKAFVRSLFGPLVKKLGFESSPDDPPELIRWRSTAIRGASSGEDPETMKQIQGRFSLLVESDDSSLIPADLETTIFCGAVAKGGEREWAKAREMYRRPKTPSEKTAALFGMCAPEDPALLRKTLDLILTDEVKTQDYAAFFSGLSNNPEGIRLLWAYFQENYDTLVQRLDGSHSFNLLVQASFSSFAREEDARAVERFFEGKETEQYKLILAQGLEEVRSRAQWLARSREEVDQWLKVNGHE
ncbi:Metalloprotease [Dacryopinax primogenitus]|uniref:Aminopeptidase n=1 Tax=Dacryopinax primogenitus (strain DJM 731) TaxID=1858805 RepID=M5GCG9_DACPD|nr:Metalloprotease [Dacryopinax primogenitus]EJU01768.1 Metalloprotease [Dacryopinax primogenitus]